MGEKRERCGKGEGLTVMNNSYFRPCKKLNSNEDNVHKYLRENVYFSTKQRMSRALPQAFAYFCFQTTFMTAAFNGLES